MIRTLEPNEFISRFESWVNDLLQQAGGDEHNYENIEFVQIACELIYQSVLFALNEYLRKIEKTLLPQKILMSIVII